MSLDARILAALAAGPLTTVQVAERIGLSVEDTRTELRVLQGQPRVARDGETWRLLVPSLDSALANVAASLGGIEATLEQQRGRVLRALVGA
jgi:hypothetical protein